MVLPPGATKGAGLERLLTLCGLSPRNLAAFGDAENDLSMLTLAEVSVAVADAVPAVIETSDLVATAPGPQGVLEILREYPLGRKFLDIPLKRERPIPLGQTETGVNISIPAARLAGRNLGVFGNSGTGKSWMVVSLIEEGGVSLVLDLSQYPVTLRTRYLAELLRALRPVRERKFRPHWIVLDDERFAFCAERGYLGVEAASLYELSRLIPTIPLESLEYHDCRGDFVKWAEGTLGDGGLASRLKKVANRRYQGEELWAALNQVVSAHYEEIRQQR
jgi:hypothetical protein